jgi:hypothetical protein
VAEISPLRVTLRDLSHITSGLIITNPDNYCLLLVVTLNTRQATVSCDVTVIDSMMEDVAPASMRPLKIGKVY